MRFVFIGMGGSGIVGDVLKQGLKDVDIESLHSSNIPKRLFKGSHFIIISYSGNTMETIQAFKKIKRLPYTIITSGGYLMDYAIDTRNRVEPIPKGFVPRDAFSIMVKAAYNILSEFVPLPEFPKIEKPNKTEIEKMMVALEKTPIIYSSSEDVYPAAYRLKTQVNENLKRHAFSNKFTELCHNEIEATDVKHYSYIILSDDKNNKYINAWKRATRNKIKQVHEFKLIGDTIFKKILYGIRLGDEATIRLAEKTKIERIKTPMIKRYKGYL